MYTDIPPDSPFVSYIKVTLTRPNVQSNLLWYYFIIDWSFVDKKNEITFKYFQIVTVNRQWKGLPFKWDFTRNSVFDVDHWTIFSFYRWINVDWQHLEQVIVLKVTYYQRWSDRCPCGNIRGTFNHNSLLFINGDER